MSLNMQIQSARKRLDVVQEVILNAAKSSLIQKRDVVGFALIRAALDDALAITVLLDRSPQRLAGPALTLVRPLTEKLKRASWAFVERNEVVIDAYENDKFPGGNDLVRVIEAADPSRTLFRRLFDATPPMLNGFVHGGAVLIRGYENHDVRGHFPEAALVDVLNYVGDLAVEAGLMAATLVGNHDEAVAIDMTRKLNAIVR